MGFQKKIMYLFYWFKYSLKIDAISADDLKILQHSHNKGFSGQPYPILLKTTFLLFNLLSIVLSGSVYAQKWPLQIIAPGSSSQTLTDSLSLVNFYSNQLSQLHQQGYWYATLTTDTLSANRWQLSVTNGPQVVWQELRLINPPALLSQRVQRLLQRKKGMPVNMPRLQRLQQQLLAEIKNQGYPFARILADTAFLSSGNNQALADEENKHYLLLHWLIEQGEQFTIDSVYFPEELSRSRAFLTRSSGLVGQVWSEQKVVDAANVLSSFPYLRLAGKPQSFFWQGQSSVFIPLRKRSASQFDALLGIFPNADPEGKARITGRLLLDLHNAFGRGRLIKVHFERFKAQSQQTELRYKQPFFLGSSLGVDLGVNAQSRDSTLRQQRYHIGTFTALSARSELGIFAERYTTDPLGNATAEFGQVGVKQWLYGLSLTQVHWQGSAPMQRGWQAKVMAKTGSKQLSDTLNNDQLWQADVQASVQNQFFLAKQLSLFSALNVGYLGSKQLFLAELYQLGGFASVRGFNENEFLAGRYGWLNAELRAFPDQQNYLFLLTDVAFFHRPDIGAQRLLGLGGGVHLQTNSGNFLLVYALGATNNQPLQTNQAKIHVGYTSTF
jgi:outer membrane protein assembly factor BamA